MKNNFLLCIKEKTLPEKIKEEGTFFNIDNNRIFNNEYEGNYLFDKIIMPNNIKENLIENEENLNNLTYVIYGEKKSGKSTLLRGSKKIDNLEYENIGMILSKINLKYNKIFDILENQDDIVVLKFGAFCCKISEESNELINLIKINNNNKTTSNKNNKNNNINNNNKNYKTINYFDEIIDKKFVIKHLSSFDDLKNIMKDIIKEKDKLFHNDYNYYILYHFSLEIKDKNNININKYESKINFYEINCIDSNLLQSLLLSINNFSNIINIKLKSFLYSNDYLKNQIILNILCLNDLTFYNKINILSIERFLQLNYNRNDLYDESSELCDYHIKLNKKIEKDIEDKKKLLNEIELMKLEANQIFNMLQTIQKYKKKGKKYSNEFKNIQEKYENLTEKVFKKK
jgi:hypothetical protein